MKTLLIIIKNVCKPKCHNPNMLDCDITKSKKLTL